ncbi:MAG: antibiotic biosynthesis monooxygenase [Pseudomonadota bacterium]|nr:antibiotic biosynthesis monooxygenase [Pseudomonadota bacterium]
MHAVIFEVEPRSKKRKLEYLDLARNLREELEKIDGFLSVERFQSLVNRNKLVSLSFWRDEQAIINWRNHIMHKKAQTEGYATIFSNYRIRVAEITRDYDMENRKQAPQKIPTVTVA